VMTANEQQLAGRTNAELEDHHWPNSSHAIRAWEQAHRMTVGDEQSLKKLQRAAQKAWEMQSVAQKVLTDARAKADAAERAARAEYQRVFKKQFQIVKKIKENSLSALRQQRNAALAKQQIMQQMRKDQNQHTKHLSLLSNAFTGLKTTAPRSLMNRLRRRRA